jgi:alkanesulfonate monooxygenase SsuD/methylene tetrahydromethanopterin reductase-like flavin-dependent oxidoreductase (luciferase family)
MDRGTSFGLTLPNRGVAIGAFTAGQLLDMAQAAEHSGRLEHVWVGDSILSKPRLEAIALLGALAARTRRVLLGVGCMATIVQRHPVLFALQWASLDVISGGRMLLAACLGYPGAQTPAAGHELRVMGVESKERTGRLLETMQALRLLWSDDHATYAGKYYRFEDVNLQPKPVQRPCPIWIASNPSEQNIGADGVERALRRVGEHGDGWMTTLVTPEMFKTRWAKIKEYAKAAGRDPSSLKSCLYYNLNVQADQQRAYDETKEFLEAYYSMTASHWFVDAWTAYGPVDACIARLQAYIDAGLDMITIRLTSWNQDAQYRIYTEEVLPALRAKVAQPRA